LAEPLFAEIWVKAKHVLERLILQKLGRVTDDLVPGLNLLLTVSEAVGVPDIDSGPLLK
jgi:hypothetical protein